MKFDFSNPQHQSVKGIVIMFADSLQNIIRGLWVPLLLVLYKFDWSKIVFVGFGLLLLLVLIGFVAYLQFKNFTFFLDETNEEFVIQKGIFSKNKITIQLDKIQQVNINQSVIQKLIGVFSVDIDTAGSQKKEVSIRAVDNEVALLLKDKLLSFEKTSFSIQNKEESELKEDPFLKVSFLTLFKVGLTSNYSRSFALIIGAIVSLYGGFSEVSNSIEVDEEQVTNLVQQGIAYFSISFLLLGVFVLVIVFNLIRTIIKYFDYQVVLRKNSIAITYGLFAKKNTLVKPEKVQVTAFSQNYLQKKLNLFDVKLKQASAAEESDKETKSAVIEIPGCNYAERETLINMILKEVVPSQETINPNIRFAIISVFFGIIIPVSIFLFAGIALAEKMQEYFLLLPIYILLMSVLIYFKYQNYRLLLSDKQIIVKHNAWDVEHLILQPYKIQGITVKQYFWQKSADIVHLTFHTAAGNIGFQYANYTKVKPWINYWLYEVERSDQSWM